jgi:hypothetical protein
MTERNIEIEAFGKRLPPEVEQRVDQAMQKFRANHRHPANLALHAAGYYSVLKGLARLFRGKRFRAVFLILFGLGMVIAGHEIEGTDAFAILKGDKGPQGNGHLS